jgi:methyltransferase (TIGR00027 family)
MAKQTVSRTALGAATMRLIEQYQEKAVRLFEDAVVKDLVGPSVSFMMRFDGMRRFTLQQSDLITEGIYGMQVCRTRYIDDVVQASLDQSIRQVVILGAGLDTRAYRLAGLRQAAVFEADLPAAQADKRRKLEKLLGGLPEHVRFVPIDFDCRELADVLRASGFDSQRPALFIWEGVTQYVSEAGVRATLDCVGKCAPGSRLVFTYVLKSIIERRSDIPNANQMMDRVKQQAPWIFGLEPAGLTQYLETFHLKLLEDAGAAEYRVRYLEPLGRKDKVFPGERIVSAQVV